MIFDRVAALVAEQFMVDTESIEAETHFIDDLGADSLDVVELVMAMELEFDIPEVPDEDLKTLFTVGSVVNYISGIIDED